MSRVTAWDEYIKQLSLDSALTDQRKLFEGVSPHTHTWDDIAFGRGREPKLRSARKLTRPVRMSVTTYGGKETGVLVKPAINLSEFAGLLMIWVTVASLERRVSSMQAQLDKAAQAQRLLQTARTQLDEIAKLPDDWDSYGAKRPTGGAISTAYGLLASLWESFHHSPTEEIIPWAIAPLADGGVQFEWRGPGGAVEVEIDPDGVFNYLVEQNDKTVGRSDPSHGAAAKEVLDRIHRVLDR